MTQTESLFKTIILLQHLAELHKTDDIDIYQRDLANKLNELKMGAT